MDLELRGKVALVTGSSRGIGRAIAMALAGEGCRVHICARGRGYLEATATELRATGAEIMATTADLSTARGIEEVVAATVRTFSGIDVLVNNVGGGGGVDSLTATDEDWQHVFNLNVFAAVRASRLVIPHMLNQGGGTIVNIASIYGREAGGSALYNAAKAAEISIAKQFARLHAPQIRVNSVAPGSILFPGGSWARRLAADPNGMAAFVKAEMPYGRFGHPEEVANVVTFLASSRASLVSGACIPVDGCQGRSNI